VARPPAAQAAAAETSGLRAVAVVLVPAALLEPRRARAAGVA
jgi:hypothetical protein